MLNVILTPPFARRSMIGMIEGSEFDNKSRERDPAVATIKAMKSENIRPRNL